MLQFNVIALYFETVCQRKLQKILNRLFNIRLKEIVPLSLVEICWSFNFILKLAVCLINKYDTQ